MKARLISVLLVIALLVTVGIITAQAASMNTGTATTANYKTIMNGAKAAVESAPDFSAGGSVTARCEACDKNVTWESLIDPKKWTDSTSTTYHYYVPTGGKTITKSYDLGTSKATVHIHLNNQTISSNKTVFTSGYATGSTLVVMGAGEVVCTSAEPTVVTASNLMLIGGIYKNTGGGDVVQNRGNLTKRTTISAPAKIDGTFNCCVEGLAESYQKGNIKILGAEVNKFIGPRIDSNTAAVQNFVLYKDVKIGDFDISAGKTPTFSLTTGADIKVSAAPEVIAAFDTEDEANALLPYVTPKSSANEIQVKKADNGRYYLTMVEKADAVTCSGCGERAVFTELPAAEAGAVAAGHYRLTGNWGLTGALTVATDVCIDLNGHDITSTGLVLDQTAGTVNVFGTGTVIGGAASGNAATANVTGGTLNLLGGEYKHTNASTLPTLYIGADVTANLSNVTLTADADVIGTNLSAGNCTMEIRDSIIENGVAPSTAKGGGNVYAISADIVFVNTIIRNGTATNATRGGGNIYTETGTLKYTDCQILSVLPEDITAETARTAANGGSIYHRSGSETFDEGTVISGGYATNGGSVFMYAGTVNFVDGTFTGGMADRGAFLAQLAPTMYAAKGSEVNVFGGIFNEGMISNSDDADRGKTFLVRAGKMNLTGGTFNSLSNGSSSMETGCAINIAATSDPATLVLTESTDADYKIPEIVINDDYPQNAIRIADNENCHVTVTSRFNDDIVLYYEGLDYGEVAGVYTPVKNVDYTGSVVVSNPDLNGVPLLHDGNNNLVVANVKVGDAWYTAQQAYNNEEISEFQLLGDATLTVAAENSTKIDLNGKNITVDGTGAFNAYNSNSAEAAEATLGAGVTSGTEDGYEFSAWNKADKGGFYYVAIEERDENNARKVSYHKLTMAMTSIALRPSVAGLYYTSMIKTDDVLAEYIDYAGIFIGTTHTNQNNVDALEGRMRAAKDDETITNLKSLLAYAKKNGFRAMVPDTDNWAQITSVMVKNILQMTDVYNKENDDNGQMPVVGTPFVMFYFGDDETGVDVVLPSEDFKEFSVKDYLKSVEKAVKDGDITNDFDSTVTSTGPLDRLKQFCVDYGIYKLTEWNITEQSWVEPPKPEEA